MEKVLTIIVPAYNMEGFLRICLDSLIIEDIELLDSLEVLVVNDGSQDSTLNIAREYEKQFPEVFKIIDKSNGGKGSCMNVGLSEARGKYVKELDADDFFDKNVFEEYLRTISFVDDDVILNDVAVVRKNGNIRQKWEYKIKEKQKSVLFSSIEKQFEYNIVQMHAVAYKRRMLIDMHFKQTEGISYTDQEWAFIPFVSVEKVFYFNHVLYYYLLGREGQSLDPKISKTKYNQVVRCFFKLLDVYIINKNCKNSSFLRYRLKYNFKLVYLHYLIKCHEPGNISIIEIDRAIEEKDNGFYRELSMVSISPIMPVHFVKNWHNHGAYHVLLYKLLYFYSRFILKCCKLVGISVKIV